MIHTAKPVWELLRVFHLSDNSLGYQCGHDNARKRQGTGQGGKH